MEYNVGLVSISFRGHSAREIIAASADAGVTAIEWGGDLHVPHGDIKTAKTVKQLCDQSGIATPQYGSYYKLCADGVEFSDVLMSAKELGTPVIRIWGGDRSSDTLKTEDYKAYVTDAQRICDMANGFTLCLECHKNTVTDEYHTALRFLKDVGRENLKMFWQPNQFRDDRYNLDALRALLPYVYSAHVFSWEREKKLPLIAHDSVWRQYIEILKSGNVQNYMLEFMHDNKIESLKETADTLKKWLEV